jgi:hypothetical protein
VPLRESNPRKKQTMKELIDTFLGVLDKTESLYFRNFLTNLPKDSAWYMISDYCIDDSSKANDVFTFSLLCNIDKYDNIKDLINKIAPRDLKKTKEINFEYLDFLNSPFVYHFSLIIPQQEKLLSKFLDKYPFDELLKWVYEVYENSKDQRPDMVDFFTNAQKRIKSFRTELGQSNFNKKLVRKIFLTSSFGASIMFLLQKYSSPSHVAWISDRDAIIDKHDGFAFDNMYFWYEVTVSQESFEKVNTSIIYTELEKIGRPYFDELIRIPDYIAGALASFDLTNMNNNLDIKEKYRQMFMDLFANPINQATIKVECNGEHPLSVYNVKWIDRNNGT